MKRPMLSTVETGRREVEADRITELPEFFWKVAVVAEAYSSSLNSVDPVLMIHFVRMLIPQTTVRPRAGSLFDYSVFRRPAFRVTED